jgi:serine/threonine-protein kinase
MGDHPTREELRLYLSRDGTLGPDRLGQIEEHIEACDRCQGILDEIEAESPPLPAELVRRVGGGDGDQPPTEDYPPHRGPTTDPEAPARDMIGRYVLLEKLGESGQGVVYRAREIDQVVAFDVAVKIIKEETISARSARMFVDEIRRLSRLRHEHIVLFLGSGDDHGRLFYVMQLLPGNLAKALTDLGAPFDPHDAARIMEEIVRAVRYMHANGVIHCDLKPENILMDRAGRPVVADFGLTMLLGDGLHTAAERGICGTFPYLAPEQIDSRFGAIGEASDLYSLGMIFFQLLTGKLPFPARPTSTAILSILNREPPSPSRLRAGIPPYLEHICLKCLKKNPSERYRSAADLAGALVAFREGGPPPDPPNIPVQRLLHWARSEPALASRLAVIVACSSILWSYRLVVGRYAPLPPDHWLNRLIHSGMIRIPGPPEAILVYANQVIWIAWGLASWAFQRQLNRRPREGGIHLGWRVVDVTALVLLIELDDALMSPLTVAFAVLIVASAFWDSASQILQTTMLSMVGYGLLVLAYIKFHPDQDRPYRHLHYLVGLALLGVMLAYQANRTRALARICGERHRA